MAEEESEQLHGGLVCLFMVLVAAVGAIAGGTVVLTVVTYVGDDPEPIEVRVGGPLVAEENGEGPEGMYEESYRTYDESYDDRVWTIATEYYDSANNYLDEESGQIVGFNIDVIEQVCHIANKNCKLVRDRYAHVWSLGLGRHGLMSGWYDAAQGWFITYPRLRTYQFTEPFSKAAPALFVVAKGNPTGFDWQDLTGRKIAFYEGWIADPACLLRHTDTINGLPLRSEHLVIRYTTEEVIRAVTSGEADAAFVTSDLTDAVENLEQNGPYLDRCTIGGASLMARKDSYLPNWWNQAWKVLLNSPKHEELCDRIDNIYNTFGQSSADLCLTR